MANLPNENFAEHNPYFFRTLDSSCYGLHVLPADTNNLAYLTILFCPRVVPNQKLHYFMEFESHKGPWRLNKTFVLQMRKQKASKSKSLHLFIVGQDSLQYYKMAKQDSEQH